MCSRPPPLALPPPPAAERHLGPQLSRLCGPAINAAEHSSPALAIAQGRAALPSVGRGLLPRAGLLLLRLGGWLAVGVFWLPLHPPPLPPPRRLLHPSARGVYGSHPAARWQTLCCLRCTVEAVPGSPSCLHAHASSSGWPFSAIRHPLPLLSISPPYSLLTAPPSPSLPASAFTAPL